MKYYHPLSVLIGVSIVVVQSQIAVALSPQEISQIAQDITVKIVDSQNPLNSGSGIIIKSSGNSYTVLTAYHVVKGEKQFQIFTPDQQNYQIKSVKRLPDVDLALVEFNSTKSYKVAQIGNSDKATYTTTVYVAGFPAKSAAISNPEFFFNKGQVNANGKAQRDGYNIIYDNDTLKGMSGGGIFNEQGELLGIHGRADEQEIGEKSQSKMITGIGTTIYSALRQMLVIGVDVGVKPPTVVAAAPKADDFYITGNEKYNNKDYKNAIADYTEAIRLNPKFAVAYNNRGLVRSDLGDKKGAIEDFNQALQINPKYGIAYINRGVARSDLGDKKGAIEDFNQALQINPKIAEPYIGRGNIRSDLGDKKGAIEDYSQALQINPQYAIAYYNRAIARSDLGDKKGAIEDFSQALQINPKDAIAYNKRGVARSDLGDKKEAIEDFNQALQINPKYGIAYINRGVARSDLGDKKGAIEDFNQALQINPKIAEPYIGRGNIRSDLGDKKGAIEDYSQALQINPQYAIAYYNRAIARSDLGDKKGAIEDFSQALQINPNSALTYYNRGFARADLGDKQGAIEDFQQAAKLYQEQGNRYSAEMALAEIAKLQK